MRPLLPHPGADKQRSQGASTQWSPLPVRKRGKQVWLACDACRKRKSRCDGLRPNCSACRGKGSECKFDEVAREANSITGLKKQLGKLQDVETVFDLLREGTEQQAFQVLQRLRSGIPMSEICKDSSVASSDTSGPTEEDSESALQNDDWLCRGSLGFLASEPEAPTFEWFRRDARVDRAGAPYRQNELDELQPAEDQIISCAWPVEVRRPRSRSVAVDNILTNADRVSRPETLISEHPPFLRVRTGLWSNIPIDDTLFSRIICVWLSYHAFCSPYIHPGLFIAALIAGESNSRCNPFLVSAVAAVACQRAAESLSLDLFRELSERFYQEAQERYDGQRRHQSVPTVQGLVALYEYNKHDRNDASAWIYFDHALRMSLELGLFDAPTDSDRVEQDAFHLSFTAWSLFAYQGFESLSYGKPPMIRRCHAQRPPQPREGLDIVEKWRPFNVCEGVRRDSYFWQHWQALYSLSDVLVDILDVMHPDPSLQSRGLTSVQPAWAQTVFHNLERWQENLPSVLQVRVNEMPHNLRLHAKYNLVYMSLATFHLSKSTAFPASPTASTNTDITANARRLSSTVMRAAQNILRLATIGTEHYNEHYATTYEGPTCYAAAITLLNDCGDDSDVLRSSLLHYVTVLRAEGVCRASVLSAHKSLLHALS